jgi:hypothetical protein
LRDRLAFGEILVVLRRTASCLRQKSQHIAVMSTLAEIEAAIAVLPAVQVDELAAWLRQRQHELAKHSRGTACRSVREFFGCFASGNPQGADSRLMEADLAREAARGL